MADRRFTVRGKAHAVVLFRLVDAVSVPRPAALVGRQAKLPDALTSLGSVMDWATKLRRLVQDYERYARTLAGLHIVAFACLMIKQAAGLAAGS
mgnify:CR=1 FL=1